ncbi:DoxX family protein [Terriglobus albidus]|uniref:DoxX family protein n=1 Tax=Terriglobus albidus TaxID=1592106 RepID=UPI00164E60F3|nr:DoxX family protein [Terriglobus albidus]
MIREQQPALSLFSIGMIALGTLSVIYRDFAYNWQPVPAFHPGREALAVACGLFMVVTGVALLIRSTVALASRVVLPFLLAWLCLKIPALIVAPQIEAVWLGIGEIAMLFAGGLVIFARFSGLEQSSFFRRFTGASGLRIASIIFGLAVIPVGLSHLFYVKITASLVPSWLPFRVGFAYLTGAGQMACGLGILFLVLPRLAAYIETAMLALFAFLVWGPNTWFAAAPKMAGSPVGPRFPLTAFFITWIIAAASLLVAGSFTNERPDTNRTSKQRTTNDSAGRYA